LVESSVVIHTLSLKNFISIDVYCCRDFDQCKALDSCKQYFCPGKIETQFLCRGIHYYNEKDDREGLVNQALVGVS
jgi:S-adenosylmethionine/arginine decarboxylase-like enzyme